MGPLLPLLPLHHLQHVPLAVIAATTYFCVALHRCTCSNPSVKRIFLSPRKNTLIPLGIRPTLNALAALRRMKLDTDLFALAKAKTHARSLEVSGDGSQFVALCADSRLRVFRFATGKLRRCYDESMEAAQELQR